MVSPKPRWGAQKTFFACSSERGLKLPWALSRCPGPFCVTQNHRQIEANPLVPGRGHFHGKISPTQPYCGGIRTSDQQEDLNSASRLRLNSCIIFNFTPVGLYCTCPLAKETYSDLAIHFLSSKECMADILTKNVTAGVFGHIVPICTGTALQPFTYQIPN
jgi:hypothetical protein